MSSDLVPQGRTRGSHCRRGRSTLVATVYERALHCTFHDAIPSHRVPSHHGILPRARITKHKQAACLAKGTLFCAEKQIGSRMKEQSKVEEQAQWRQ